MVRFGPNIFIPERILQGYLWAYNQNLIKGGTSIQEFEKWIEANPKVISSNIENINRIKCNGSLKNKTLLSSLVGHKMESVEKHRFLAQINEKSLLLQEKLPQDSVLTSNSENSNSAGEEFSSKSKDHKMFTLTEKIYICTLLSTGAMLMTLGVDNYDLLVKWGISSMEILKDQISPDRVDVIQNIPKEFKPITEVAKSIPKEVASPIDFDKIKIFMDKEFPRK
jgi:hypothetical protein